MIQCCTNSEDLATLLIIFLINKVSTYHTKGSLFLGPDLYFRDKRGTSEVDSESKPTSGYQSTAHLLEQELDRMDMTYSTELEGRPRVARK